MRGEFYISQVILWNPRLRARIANLIGLSYQGGDDGHALLSEFRGPAALAAVAHRLHSDTNEVFMTLKKRLAGDVGLPLKNSDGHLTTKDLTLFRNSEFIHQIAVRLRCQSAFSTVLERLFEPEELQALLVGAGIGKGANGATLEQLFWRLLTPDGGRVISAHLGGIDVWSILETFLRNEARERLCASLNCSPTEIFVRLAAAAGKTKIKPEIATLEEDDTQILDIFGVEKMKEMLRALSSAYMHQACETAKRLGLTGVSSSLAGLFPLLDFYGRRNYRSGISSYLGNTQSLRSLCTQAIVLSSPQFEKGWILRASKNEREEKPHVLVQAISATAKEWSDLIELHVASTLEEEHLRYHLPPNSSSLVGVGDTLSDRLLSHEIPLLWTTTKKAWRLLSSFDGTWSEYFLLAGQELPDPFRCREIFGADKTATMDVRQQLQTYCPSPSEVTDQVVASYRNQAQQIQMV